MAIRGVIHDATRSRIRGASAVSGFRYGRKLIRPVPVFSQPIFHLQSLLLSLSITAIYLFSADPDASLSDFPAAFRIAFACSANWCRNHHSHQSDCKNGWHIKPDCCIGTRLNPTVTASPPLLLSILGILYSSALYEGALSTENPLLFALLQNFFREHGRQPFHWHIIDIAMEHKKGRSDGNEKA